MRIGGKEEKEDAATHGKNRELGDVWPAPRSLIFVSARSRRYLITQWGLARWDKAIAEPRRVEAASVMGLNETERLKT